jgi:TolB protein
VAVQTLAATGQASLDPDGYTVIVEGFAPRSIEPNGAVSLADVPVGDYGVGLEDLQVNCTTPETPAEVTVSEDTVAQLSFLVTCWPPTTGRIVFTSDVNGTYDLWSMNHDGTDLSQLTINVSAFMLSTSDLFPAWSLDGWKIAYLHQDMPSRNIWVMNADGTGPTQLTHTTDGSIRNMYPSWSPDGSRITFSSDRAGNLHVYVIDTDGTNLVQLTSGTNDDLSPSWSPDGSKIVFTRAGVSGGAGVFMMNPDGTEQVMLTRQQGWWDWVTGRSCSPDGSRIVMASDRDGNSELYMMDADGSNQVRLTYSEDRAEEAAAWSPDGTMILYTSVIDGTGETHIYTMNADGTGGVRIASSMGGSGYMWPDWSHGTGAVLMEGSAAPPGGA